MSAVSREPVDAWIAAYVGAVRQSNSIGLPPWPNQVPPLGRPTPVRVDVRGWRRARFPLVAVVATAVAVVGLAVQPWLRDFVIVVVACLIAGAGVGIAMAVGRARFVADARGLRVRQPLGSAVLPWSAVVGIRCPAPRRDRCVWWRRYHRIKVVLELADGTLIAPFALQRRVNLRRPQGVERAVAEWHDLTELWRCYGPPAATTMWGRPAVSVAPPYLVRRLTHS